MKDSFGNVILKCSCGEIFPVENYGAQEIYCPDCGKRFYLNRREMIYYEEE